MPPGPDSQSFTRLLISAGALLLIAAFVVPGLILRDTGVLTISRQELRRLTPSAEREVERRQEVARDVGRAAPYIAVFFLVSGGLLMAVGVPRLRRLEQSDDERRRMELEKLRGELRPQSAEEQRERLREEVDEDETQEAPLSAEARLRETANAEEAVLARIAEIVPPLYDLESKVVVSDGDRRLFLDGLLISEIDQLPDVVVEVKYVRKGIVDMARRIREAKAQLLDHLTAYRRTSIGWLIVVTEGPLPERRREIEEGIAKEVVPGPHLALRLSIVTLDDLDSLRPPISI